MPSSESIPPDAATWQRIRPLLDRLLDLPTELRGNAMADAGLTRADRELVVSLLEDAEDDAVDVLERPPLEIDPSELPAPPRASQAGDRVGPWELRRRLGAGGTSEVWSVARVDGQFAQRGALKRLHHGLESDELVAQFERERQVLASIEDPSIARLIDGGVDDEGRPYLVLEYVEGEPIDAWCRARRVSVRGRVELLARVARAVDVAHARLIVHRDLKPSNVLIDTDGRPRLIDFGVSKVLDPEKDAQLVTRDVAHYLTPLFASPEQFTGTTVTTASDVYSLGALGYQLFSGKTPLDIAGLGAAEAVRQVTLEDPLPPSEAAAMGTGEDEGIAVERGTTPKQLMRALAGDLDTILLRCLRKEPGRRYSRASELADDLERWLRGSRVLARRDTVGYRVKRFVRRHRLVVALTTLAFALLLTGLSIALVQRSKLMRQSVELAERSARSANLLEDLRASIGGLTTLHYPDLAAVPGTERVMARLTRTLGAIASEQDDPELLTEAVRAYWLNGGSVWTPFQANAGDPKDAARSIHKARALGLDLAARPDTPLRAYAVISDALAGSAWAQLHDGALETALEQARIDEAWMEARMVLSPQALVGPEALAVPSTSDGGSIDRIALGWIDLRRCRVNALMMLGRQREALETAVATLKALDSFEFDDPTHAGMLDEDRRRLDAVTATLRGRLGVSGQPSPALPSGSTPESSPVWPHGPPTAPLTSDRLSEMRVKVATLVRSGLLDQARKLVLVEMDAVGDSIDRDLSHEKPSRERAWVRYDLAEIERIDGRATEAKRHAAVSLAEFERCVNDRPAAWIEEIDLRAARLSCGRTTARAGDAVEGARLLGLVLDHADRSLAANPVDWTARLAAVDACCALAQLQASDEARAGWLDRAGDHLRGSWTDAPDSLEIRERRSQIALLR